MATTEEQISALKKKHPGDSDNLIAWFLGYVGAAERELNNVRRSIGVEPKQTLEGRLNEEIQLEKPF